MNGRAVINRPSPTTETEETAQCRIPSLADAQAMWRIARDSVVLDLNSSYAYLLWCKDFSETSVVAEVDGSIAGFVTGYRPPHQPDTLMVWQVAVAEQWRGRGIARAMLDALADRPTDPPVKHLETTITADNAASQRLFAAFAAARGARVERRPGFEAAQFPDDHDAELLFHISPVH